MVVNNEPNNVLAINSKLKCMKVFSVYPKETDVYTDTRKKMRFEINTKYDKDKLTNFVKNAIERNAIMYNTCIAFHYNGTHFHLHIETMKYQEGNEERHIIPTITGIEHGTDGAYTNYIITIDLSSIYK